MSKLLYEDKTYKIIGAAIEVHKTLGCGFSEHVYQDALEVEFKKRGIPHEREKRLLVNYKDVILPHDYYPDFVCYDDIILELKAVTSITDLHVAQLMNYMKIQNWKIGLLLNFGETSLKFERKIL